MHDIARACHKQQRYETCIFCNADSPAVLQCDVTLHIGEGRGLPGHYAWFLNRQGTPIRILHGNMFSDS
jgi:hypothetical protein